MARRATKHSPIVAASSSAPIFPCLASPSESLVNPEMSTKATVPSTTRCRRSGRSSIQSTTSRGRYGARRSRWSLKVSVSTVTRPDPPGLLGTPAGTRPDDTAPGPRGTRRSLADAMRSVQEGARYGNDRGTVADDRRSRSGVRSVAGPPAHPRSTRSGAGRPPRPWSGGPRRDHPPGRRRGVPGTSAPARTGKSVDGGVRRSGDRVTRTPGHPRRRPPTACRATAATIRVHPFIGAGSRDRCR